jgi:LacI family transcriptional regulator
MERKHQITIKDIAKELKISVATVSRAFRNTHDVSEETKNKVLAKAEELNYRRNFNATALAGHKSHNIAVIVPTITNFYFSTVFTGIQDVAYKNGYNIILYVTGESSDRETVIVEGLSLSSIDGLLICVTSESSEYNHLKKIIDYGIPIVFFDRAADIINTSKVIQNDFEGAFMAVEHLVKNGYKNIAHIGGSLGFSLTRERLRGYLFGLKKYNLLLRQDWIIHSEFTQLSGSLDTKKLWECKNKPDAIFAVNDRKAIGAMVELKKRGIQIGKKVGVVGFTNDPMSEIISPSLTTIEEPASEIGKKSCELLLMHLSKKNFTPKEIVLYGKLIVRESSFKKLNNLG